MDPACGPEPLIRTTELRILRLCRPPGLRIEGVVDLRTHRHLRTALDVIAPTDGDLQLELSRLEYLDIGGLRMLISFAGTRDESHHVELTGLAPHLRNVIALVGWDEAPGLRLGAHRAH